MKVLKFGGSSMANAKSILQSLSIAKNETDAIIVVSAPGKCKDYNKKITDMLIDCHQAMLKCGRCDVPFAPIRQRFLDLCKDLRINSIDSYLNQILHDINSGAGYMYTISRGEYLSSLIMRHLLDCELTDASQLIKFDIFGKLDTKYTHECIKKRLSGCKMAVVPGFYGSLPNGEIKTFSRGGSDVTGAIIASAINAQIYENWTDVDGIYFCSATHLCSPIDELTYRQARALTFMGAYVLHPDSVVYLQKHNITCVIKNTFNPKAKGTTILPQAQNQNEEVLAISGQKGFKMLNFYKMGGIDEDFFNQITDEVKKQGAKIFFHLGGVDTFTLIVFGTVDLDNIESQQDIALFTILTKNKRSTLQKLQSLDIDYKIITLDHYSDGITIATSQSDFTPTQEKLCKTLHHKTKQSTTQQKGDLSKL